MTAELARHRVPGPPPALRSPHLARITGWSAATRVLRSGHGTTQNKRVFGTKDVTIGLERLDEPVLKARSDVWSAASDRATSRDLDLATHGDSLMARDRTSASRCAYFRLYVAGRAAGQHCRPDWAPRGVRPDSAATSLIKRAGADDADRNTSADLFEIVTP
jgi:hypothetical protein